MVSTNSIDSELQLYDDIYAHVTGAVRSYGLPIFYKDNENAPQNYPQEYVYFDQADAGLGKHTLAPNVYQSDADLICEVHVTYASIEKGRRMVAELKRAIVTLQNLYGIVIEALRQTDAKTPTGVKYIVTVQYNHLTRVV